MPLFSFLSEIFQKLLKESRKGKNCLGAVPEEGPVPVAAVCKCLQSGLHVFRLNSSTTENFEKAYSTENNLYHFHRDAQIFFAPIHRSFGEYRLPPENKKRYAIVENN